MAKKNDQCVATHRSLEGLVYLGMWSAAPTDMGTACSNAGDGSSENPLREVPRLTSVWPRAKKMTMRP